VRIAVVGGGIAGALLAWRLCRAPHQARVGLFTGDMTGATDATGASGGLVRGFETDQTLCRMAAESMAELRGSRQLRHWAGYREIGSVYLLPFATSLASVVEIVHEWMPGSAGVASAAQLRQRYPFRNLPEGTVGVVERRAGYISPGQLRDAVLGVLSGSRIEISPEEITGVTPNPAVRFADGRQLGYDAVVVAAGGWTPQLLASSGLTQSGLRTKHIQYTLCAAHMPGTSAFVDDTSGLYGRPALGNTLLVGLSGDLWGIPPGVVAPDHELAARMLGLARRRLGVTVDDRAPVHTVAAVDCYHEPSGLALRRVVPHTELFTFTGGSGGAAKTALAASRAAAAALLSFTSGD
jgi:glycine/D-amino acid oxidase-like deaminating enzyme